MVPQVAFDYKKEANRYQYYYRRLQIFYQKPSVQVSTAVLFTLATIIFFAVFAIRPTLQTISELLRKIEDQQKVLEQANKKSSALATAQQQLDLIEQQQQTLVSAIPEKYMVQALLLDLEATAGKLGIPLSSLKISDITYPPSIKKNEAIPELNFTITIDATYPVIKQYLQEVVKLPRFISIQSVTFTSQEDKNLQGYAPGTLTGMIKCKAFYLATPEGKP